MYICKKLQLHPAHKSEQSGDPIFNDIQFGNGIT